MCKEKFGQNKGEFEDWNRTFVQMAMDRVPLEEVDESDNAADEKIWQSFENLKEVVNNIEFPVELLQGYMKKVHCVELSEADSPTFKNSSTRRIEASLFIHLKPSTIFWPILGFSHPRMGVLFPSVI